MITEFGKELRKLRWDNDELLKDMSDRLEVTSSYLSAVEHGKREIPSTWIEKIANFYQLNSAEKATLQNAADMSNSIVKINLQGRSCETINLANAFARRLNDLDQEEIDKILKIINNKKGGKR